MFRLFTISRRPWKERSKSDAEPVELSRKENSNWGGAATKNEGTHNESSLQQFTNKKAEDFIMGEIGL